MPYPPERNRVGPAAVDQATDSHDDPGTGRPGWMAAAGCRGVPTAVFYDAATEAEAIGCCAGCAVQSVCLAHALQTAEPDGVWGGLPARRRRDLLAGRAAEARRPGPQRHLGDGELRELLADADPDRPAVAQLLERVPLSTAGAYLYLARARELGLVERRGRLLYPALCRDGSAGAQPTP
jgi:WhiB family redox-sensing transcriptional regulator